MTADDVSGGGGGGEGRGGGGAGGGGGNIETSGRRTGRRETN